MTGTMRARQWHSALSEGVFRRDRRGGRNMTARARITERHFDSLRDNAMNTSPIPKPHFMFGRMRICIDSGRVHRDAEYIRRKPTVKQYVSISMPDSVRQRLIADATAVYEPVLHVGLTAIEGGQPEPPRQRDALRFMLEEDGLLGKTVATDFGNTLQPRFGRRSRGELQYRTSVVRHRERNVRA